MRDLSRGRPGCRSRPCCSRAPRPPTIRARPARRRRRRRRRAPADRDRRAGRPGARPARRPGAGDRGPAGLRRHRRVRGGAAARALRGLRDERRRRPAGGLGQPADRLGAPARVVGLAGSGPGAVPGGRESGGRLRGRRRPRPLPPEERDAVLAVEPPADRAGRAGPEGGLLPLRHRGRPEPRPAAGPAGLLGGRHPLLRAGGPGLHVAADGDVGRLAATSTGRTWPTSGSTCRTRPPGPTSWAPRPTPRTGSGRAAARPRRTRRPSTTSRSRCPGGRPSR